MKISWTMMPIGGPKSDQTAVGDAMRKTAQETKKLYTRKLHGIPRSCPEIPRSSLEYQEGDFDEINRQTDRHPHTYTHTHIHTSRIFYEHQETILEYHAFTECQEAFMQYKEAFMDYKDGLWNRKRLFWNIKKLLCNTKKPLLRSF